MSLHDDALHLATAYGWKLFQVAADCRTPIKSSGHFERGCYDATSDPEELFRRFVYAPRANIALACGDGLLALDVDAKGNVDGFAALAELEAEFGELPKTVRSCTPSNGAHLLFTYAGPSPLNRVGVKRFAADGSRRVYSGLDVRAAGASVTLPPSRRSDGSYGWTVAPWEHRVAPAPLWLLALMRSEQPSKPRLSPPKFKSSDRLARYVAAAVNRECFDLATRRAPGRNAKLFQSAANLGEFVGAGLLPREIAEDALERAAEECGLVSEDGLRAVQASIGSGLRRGISNPREVTI